ncbi:MAG TPA: preprotein translocase subunit SecE [Chloroflexota bacterium]
MPVKEREKQVRAPAAKVPSARPRVPGLRLGESVREVRSELRKVVWPTRDEAIRLTVVVIGVCTAVGLFLGAADYLFAQMFQLILR